MEYIQQLQENLQRNIQRTIYCIERDVNSGNYSSAEYESKNLAFYLNNIQVLKDLLRKAPSEWTNEDISSFIDCYEEESVMDWSVVDDIESALGELGIILNVQVVFGNEKGSYFYVK